jgi:cytochrome P450 PksS
MPAFFRAMERNMLDLDDPDHARLRTLVHKAFTPRTVEGLRERTENIALALLDAMEEKLAREGQVDLVSAFALPLPMTVIADLLGVPAADQHRFHRWSNRMVGAQGGTLKAMMAVPSMMAFMRYMGEQFRQRRAEPRDDLLTALVEAEETGDRLSEDELLAMTLLLLIAGHETTVNLIASGTLALLQHPSQRARLQADPALMRPAVEELLRYTSPVETATERYAAEDVTLHGVTLPKGEMVLAALASANRDPAQFPNPDVLDIGRTPNRHLAFGQGAHFCLGAPLARLEGQIALGTLLNHFPNLTLAVDVDSLRWRPGMVLRGLQALPVRA